MLIYWFLNRRDNFYLLRLNVKPMTLHVMPNLIVYLMAYLYVFQTNGSHVI